MSTVRSARRLFAASLVTLVAVAATARAQDARPPALYLEYATDDELENYLRTLQALGDVPELPWTLRPLSPVALDALHPASSSHPWSARVRPADTTGGPRWTLIRPRVGLRYNSAFPFGSNDGAVWAGRGLTASASGGAAFRWGPLSATLDPIVFWTQNQAFPLLDNGLEGPRAYADGVFPTVVDRPQRFGDDTYARADAGQSGIRLDGLGMSLGFSTGNLWWGPAQEYPFLLGTNAAGFPHVFVGTSRPANLWLLKAHTQVIWGRLEQSDYFVPVGIQRARRFATGLILAVTPRGLDNLEVGAARFFHAPWPDEGLPGRYISRPFEGLIKKKLPRVDSPIPNDERSQDGENQLASVFTRLVLPGTGFEAYAEFGREDHPWDVRYLLLSPDEQSSLTIGFRKSWRRGADGASLVTLRGESIDFRQTLIDFKRGGRAIYIHANGSNQGHTQRGQLLGADVGVGSAGGSILGVDLIGRSGRTTFEWRRVLRQELPVFGPDSTANPSALDVLHTLSAERLLFRGATELTAGLDFSYDFNRNFDRDRTNIGVRLAATGLPW
jgi:hypothetical protein